MARKGVAWFVFGLSELLELSVLYIELFDFFVDLDCNSVNSD